MPDIQCFGKGHVKFQNGKSVEIDAVLFATGYMSTCSFLDGLDFPFPGKRRMLRKLDIFLSFTKLIQTCMNAGEQTGIVVFSINEEMQSLY